MRNGAAYSAITEFNFKAESDAVEIARDRHTYGKDPGTPARLD